MAVRGLEVDSQILIEVAKEKTMSINFNNAFGVHEAALSIRSQRAEVLANNLANSDTPNFKARDIDFSKALEQAQVLSLVDLIKPIERILTAQLGQKFQDFHIALPLQPDTGDGNSVDAQYEQTKFAENAMQYETSLRFLDGKIKGLLTAIRGE